MVIYKCGCIIRVKKVNLIENIIFFDVVKVIFKANSGFEFSSSEIWPWEWSCDQWLDLDVIHLTNLLVFKLYTSRVTTP